MEFKNLLHEKMRSLGAAAYKKFLGVEVIHNWEIIFDENISANVKPVKIERGVLFVAVESSAFKDQLKFFKEEIIDTINENFAEEEPLVKEVRLASAFQVAEKFSEKILPPAQIEKPSKLEDVTLTAEEIKSCEEQSQKISNPKLRESALQMLLNHKREQKYKLANGWHKCLRCESLCAPKEIFCGTCAIKERELMNKELFGILYDAPQIKTWEAQKILLEKMPHMKDECSLAAVESARASLIQKVVSKVRFGDEESDEVLRLVALEKRLPPEKLTPAIIRRTLIDMQFDLSEQPKIQRYLSKARKN